MPSNFYHLKFELYPYPTSIPTNTPHSNSNSSSSRRKSRTKEEEEERRREIYVPPSAGKGSDIFENREWPTHPAVALEEVSRKSFSTASIIEGGVKQDIWGEGDRKVVIDCGPTRASTEAEGGGQGQGLGSIEPGFPIPKPGNIEWGLDTARRDWRFGRVRVESLDLQGDIDMDMESKHTPSPRRRGESSSAGAGSNALTAGLAASTNAVGGGRVTKARFDATEGKNTELGWGVVHLYRDGEESLGLGAPLPEEIYSADDNVGNEVEEDYTVLCIPAVPSYLTSSDFLGFVGEKTREQVSHFRMVMTGRMNRYLVLMKFRDGSVARKWRREFDGKVFNSMEVSTLPSLLLVKEADFPKAGNLPCNVHQVNHLPISRLLTPKYKLPRTLPRSLHSLSISLDIPQTFPSSNTESRRTPNLPRMSRAHGRHNRSPNHPLPTRFPLRLSPKMERQRLPRLQTHESLSRRALSIHYLLLPLRSLESSFWIWSSFSMQRMRLH
jgi:hypothetical protein